MRLNEIKAHAGSKQTGKRVGRGIGSGHGKTAGRGHKGQKSRSGGYHKTGFEGGQMPIQRRLPKVGFSSRVGRTHDEIRLCEIAALDVDKVDLNTLYKAGLIARKIRHVKLILQGSIDRPVTITGLKVTKGAQAAIEAAGGKVVQVG